MIVSKGVFYFLCGSSGLLAGGLVYYFIRNLKVLSFSAKIVAGIIVGILAALPWLEFRTVVILIEEDSAVRKVIIGSADFQLSNGETIHAGGLSHGELIINNTNDTCVIERIEYFEEDQEMSNLSNYLILVKPMSAYPFHGSEVQYLFQEPPEYIESYDHSSRAQVNHVLRLLRPTDHTYYYLYDGPVEWGNPLVEEQQNR